MKKIIQDISMKSGKNWTIVFGDFLRYVINGFSLRPEHFEWDYSPECSALFLALFGKWAEECHRGVVEHGWYDALGNLYENMSLDGGSQKQHAQFFTPAHLSELCSALAQHSEGWVNDPTCGSGRLLLSYLAKHPDEPCRAEDIDPVACRMCVCNLLIHGFTGEVVCHDALKGQPVKFAYRVNGHFRTHGHVFANVPHIERIM